MCWCCCGSGWQGSCCRRPRWNSDWIAMTFVAVRRLMANSSVHSEHEGLTRLIEHLQARLGSEQVQQLALIEDHARNAALLAVPSIFRAEAGPPIAGRVRLQVTAPACSLCRGTHAEMDAPWWGRPVWLLAEPEPLQERGPHPLLDGRPLRLLGGPERIACAVDLRVAPAGTVRMRDRSSFNRYANARVELPAAPEPSARTPRSPERRTAPMWRRPPD